ncbi:MAG: class I SAM-dependent methyltransferase [Deltaproteobacteria bacterium]
MIFLKNTPEYCYPDGRDIITTRLIDNLETKEGYWEKSEKYILGKVKRHIKENLTEEGAEMLDAGCGFGRLIPILQPFFSKVIALEPDKKRLSEACSLVKKMNMNNVEFINGFIEEYNFDKQFDAILCSHVVQHISLSSTERVFNRFGELLKLNGLLIIMTCLSKGKEDKYAKSYILNEKHIEERISKESFEELVMNYSEGLPVHFFSRSGLEKFISENGFELVEIRRFHVLKRGSSGTDVLLIARKNSCK